MEYLFPKIILISEIYKRQPKNHSAKYNKYAIGLQWNKKLLSNHILIGKYLLTCSLYNPCMFKDVRV